MAGSGSAACEALPWGTCTTLGGTARTWTVPRCLTCLAARPGGSQQHPGRGSTRVTDPPRNPEHNNASLPPDIAEQAWRGGACLVCDAVHEDDQALQHNDHTRKTSTRNQQWHSCSTMLCSTRSVPPKHALSAHIKQVAPPDQRVHPCVRAPRKSVKTLESWSMEQHVQCPDTDMK